MRDNRRVSDDEGSLPRKAFARSARLAALPLGYAGLASQKNYLSLYLGCVYLGCDGDEPSDFNGQARVTIRMRVEKVIRHE